MRADQTRVAIRAIASHSMLNGLSTIVLSAPCFRPGAEIEVRISKRQWNQDRLFNTPVNSIAMRSASERCNGT